MAQSRPAANSSRRANPPQPISGRDFTIGASLDYQIVSRNQLTPGTLIWAVSASSSIQGTIGRRPNHASPRPLPYRGSSLSVPGTTTLPSPSSSPPVLPAPSATQDSPAPCTEDCHGRHLHSTHWGPIHVKPRPYLILWQNDDSITVLPSYTHQGRGTTHLTPAQRAEHIPLAPLATSCLDRKWRPMDPRSALKMSAQTALHLRTPVRIWGRLSDESLGRVADAVAGFLWPRLRPRWAKSQGSVAQLWGEEEEEEEEESVVAELEAWSDVDLPGSLRSRGSGR